jgi:TRAP-type uncharacterized transport system substrate-binding protein
MKFAKILISGFLILFAVFVISACSKSFEEQKTTEIIALSTPFGTAGYTSTMAFEETFKKSDSWIKLKTKETPGAMYMFKYMADHHKKMASGEMPQAVIPVQGGLLSFVVGGRPPFQDVPNPDLRALFSMQAVVFFIVTFDPEIGELKNLAGKKIGVSEKARVFQNDLLTRPYFSKGLGIWNQVNWQYLGSIVGKDALLNNRIDAKMSLFVGNIVVASDGTYVCTKLVPENPVLELMNAGRKLDILEWDPRLIEKSYDVSNDMAMLPILVKQGACKGIDQDIWAIGTVAKVIGSASIPDSVVEELIRVRHYYRKEFGKVHPILELLPESPYPVGTPDGYVHSGVKKAMKNLGLAIPLSKP